MVWKAFCDSCFWMNGHIVQPSLADAQTRWGACPVCKSQTRLQAR